MIELIHAECELINVRKMRPWELLIETSKLLDMQYSLKKSDL